MRSFPDGIALALRYSRLGRTRRTATSQTAPGGSGLPDNELLSPILTSTVPSAMVTSQRRSELMP